MWTSLAGGALELSLRAWHCRLADHFTSLRRHRDSRWPIFALEHGLDEICRAGLAKAVVTDVASGLTGADDAWLPYVVYASEFGYRYVGDGFWPTFAAETPGWAGSGEQARREWIRAAFFRFHREYGGYRPTGAFADNFNIIAWPIAHAILPRDHQRALAKVLYDLRDTYSAELLESAEFLGQRVAERAASHGSRFGAFCNPPDLVGFVSQALLLDSQTDGPSLLSPATFQRIVGDAEKILENRPWLRDARGTARQITGILPRAPGTRTLHVDEEPVRGADVVVEPRLVLRPIDSSHWSVCLVFPSFAALAERHPEVGTFLTRSRLTIPAAGRRELGDWLCYDPPPVRLRRWPAPNQPLLQFDATLPDVLAARLQTEVRLRPGPVYLFERRADGTAAEVVGRRVRPGGRYLLLAPISALPCSPLVSPLEVHCEGLALASLDLATALADPEQSALVELGLAVGRRIDLWPVGLPPAAWNGQGDLEILESGIPAVALRADHDVRAFFISHVASGWKLGPLQPSGAGSVAIAPLNDLAPGAHRLQVRAAVGVKDIETLGEFEVRIRRRRDWNAARPTRRPLRVIKPSVGPSMGSLWEGRIDLEVDGEPGSPLAIVVHYFEGNERELPCAETVAGLALPLDRADVRDALGSTSLGRPASVTLRPTQLFRHVNTCKLEFVSGPTDRLTIDIPPPQTPVALVVRPLEDTHLVGLLRVPGEDCPNNLRVERYPHAFPDSPTDITADLDGRFEETPPGCWLYVVRHGRVGQAVVVPPREGGRSLPLSAAGALELRVLQRSPTELAARQSLLALWHQADTRGDPTAEAARAFVVSCFERQLFGTLCGDTWLACERDFTRDNESRAIHTFAEQVARSLGDSTLAIPLNRLASRIATASCVQEMVSDVQHLVPRSIISPRDGAELVPFALRLAFDPVVPPSANGQVILDFTRLLGSPGIARVARFLALSLRKLSPGRQFTWS